MLNITDMLFLDYIKSYKQLIVFPVKINILKTLSYDFKLILNASMCTIQKSNIARCITLFPHILCQNLVSSLTGINTSTLSLKIYCQKSLGNCRKAEVFINFGKDERSQYSPEYLR